MITPIVFEDAFYTVSHVTSFFIPGYLIIAPKDKKNTWHEFSNEALMHLGPLIALSHACVEKVIHPERIYSNQYGELEKNIHIHIFPRTQNVTAMYLSDQKLNDEHLISGPGFVDWVFKNRHLFTTKPNKFDNIVCKIAQEFLINAYK